jgi:NitT/TauT family transport system substrate-binding protein
MILRNLSASFAMLCLLVASASASNVKVNIGYATAADYLPAFVSKENGCFADNGIDAQFTRIPVTTNMPAAVIADTLQIGAQTATLFLPAVENGLELVAIAGGTRLLQGNETISLVTSTKFQVKRAGDVVGKKIGVPGVNSVADVMFRKWLKNEGATPQRCRSSRRRFRK